MTREMEYQCFSVALWTRGTDEGRGWSKTTMQVTSWVRFNSDLKPTPVWALDPYRHLLDLPQVWSKPLQQSEAR